jgi:hypothetical protein
VDAQRLVAHWEIWALVVRLSSGPCTCAASIRFTTDTEAIKMQDRLLEIAPCTAQFWRGVAFTNVVLDDADGALAAWAGRGQHHSLSGR